MGEHRTVWVSASARQPCPVCDHDTWCRFSPDGDVVACRRTESPHPLRYGDGTVAWKHYLGDPDKTARAAQRVERPTLSEEEADLRDRVYRALLGRLGLDDDHREDLLRRGLTAEAIEFGAYASLPYTVSSFKVGLLKREFDRRDLEKVPGLVYRGDDLELTHDHGLLVPVRDTAGRIIALRVRRPVEEPKYVWLSTPDKSSGAHVHVPASALVLGAVRVTEGELKADVATLLDPDLPTISVPGVGSWRAVLPVIAALGAVEVHVAYDADKRTNPDVQRAETALVTALQEAGYVVDVDEWAGAKGIDDALVARAQIAHTPPEPPPPAPEDQPSFDDAGNARRFIMHRGHEVRYVREFGTHGWLVWDGRRWRRDPEGIAIKGLVLRTIEQMKDDAERIEDSKLREQAVKWAAKSAFSGRMDAMKSWAAADTSIAVEVGDLDRDPWLLNCVNGTVDLRNGRLRPHRQDDLITKLVPVKYDPEAKAPTWERFLLDIMDEDEEMAAYLQRAAGYTLTGRADERMMFVQHGTNGNNGKTVFSETLAAIMGDYATTIPSAVLMQTRSDRSGHNATPELAKLRGVRLAAASEGEKGQRLATAQMKEWTGGDTLTGRELYGKPFDFRPQFKLWFRTNFPPLLEAADAAAWRRLHLIPHERSFPNSDLPERLLAESEGILAWAVAGARIWNDRRLDPPAKVQAATAAYREELDVLGRFLRERCTTAPGATVASRVLYSAFKDWAQRAGEWEMSETKFSKAIAERGYVKERRAAGWFWRDLGLSADNADEEAHAWGEEERRRAENAVRHADNSDI